MYGLGISCVVCGQECSGMGKCDACGGSLCFLCYEDVDHPKGTAVMCSTCREAGKPVEHPRWQEKRNLWYVDCDGALHYLRDQSPATYKLERLDSYTAVHVGHYVTEEGPGVFDVNDTYVLHTGDENPADYGLTATPAEES